MTVTFKATSYVISLDNTLWNIYTQDNTLWNDAKQQMYEEVVSGQLLSHDRYINESLFWASSAYVRLAAPGEMGSWQKENKATAVFVSLLENYVIDSVLQEFGSDSDGVVGLDLQSTTWACGTSVVRRIVQSRVRRRELESRATTAGIDEDRDAMVQRRLQGEAVIGIEAHRSCDASVWV
ncbi:hypothetical protein M0R45_035948 [Rubus argutus]|uniref:Uncharacterized protein n=1 Tax=Rubus argutus TaxID=59490 RepID=A0AAW1VUL8_RUBAR